MKKNTVATNIFFVLGMLATIIAYVGMFVGFTLLYEGLNVVPVDTATEIEGAIAIVLASSILGYFSYIALVITFFAGIVSLVFSIIAFAKAKSPRGFIRTFFFIAPLALPELFFILLAVVTNSY